MSSRKNAAPSLAQREAWAEQIQAARRAKGLSQQELFQLAMPHGYSFSYVQKIENAAKGNEETFNELMGLIRKARKAG